VPPPFAGLTFVTGAPPAGARQVAIDEATATSQSYHVGDLVPIVTAEPVRTFRISGIVRVGGASLGGSTLAVFSLQAAQRLYSKLGRVDVIYVHGAPRSSPDAIVRETQPLLGPELLVRTAPGQVDADVQRVASQLRILTAGLLAFGFISVFVGAFVIFNTFSITVAQRMREFALLRALAASRSQVLLLVLVEAAAIGTVASIGGLFGGLAAAAGIRALFTSIGFGLPSTSLVVEPRTAIIGLLVGVLVTVIAGLVPAFRATRVAPLEAIRGSDVPAAPRGWRMRLTTFLAGLLVLVGLIAIFTSKGSTTTRLSVSAGGSVALLLAIIILSPRAIRRLTGIVGWPLARGGRVLARLARENAARNPGRTAVSASSLTVGLALVLFVTVYASGLRASVGRIIDHTLIGDFVIENQDGTSSIPAASARSVAAVPDVAAVSSLKSVDASLPGAPHITAAGIEPTTISQVYSFDWINGSQATLDDLTIGDAIVERDTARSAHLKVGEPVVVTSETGLKRTVVIRGIYKDQALLRGFALPRAAFDQIFHQPRLSAVFVKLAPDANRMAASAALDQALRQFPGVVARSQKQLRDEVGGRVNRILVLFYALLAMSVLMSLLGIVNTLTLSVHERTRELGLLRAIGMTPAQARGMIREESVITAAMGTLVGVVLGVFFAWVVTKALASEGVVFSLPWVQVLILIVVGLSAGVIAASPPARRAARIDVLSAIAEE
jgi:putative ABC transport system permease protein